ncbi:hypothetical protein NOF04DRAFT_1363346 [Fusarium oxysporum II5]|nr:hypothetical protein NOF04DRAFT_1363346 [Fusarium oxysporum II5]
MPLVFVVDAIDECSDTLSFQFLRRLYKEVHASQFPIKILITCRRNLIDRLQGQVPVPHHIDVMQENTYDIRKYVHDELDRWYLAPAKADIASKLELEIVYRAEGVFLWVVLVIEGLLRRGSRLDTVLDTIHPFPRGRDEKLRRIYEEILKQATEGLKDNGVTASIKPILSIMINSATPLSLKQMEACLATGGGDSGYICLENDIIHTCRGLLKIEEDVVRPFHTTLKSYLEDGDKCPADFHINTDEAHA